MVHEPDPDNKKKVLSGTDDGRVLSNWYHKSRKAHLGLIFAALLICLMYSVDGLAAKETKYTLTKELDREKTQHDKGYYLTETIDKDDPHYGWGLGSFYIQGYTEVTKDEDGMLVFLKNVGDELTLGFDL